MSTFFYYYAAQTKIRLRQTQDGQKRYTSEIVADNLIMLDRASGTQSYGGGNTYQPTPNNHPKPTTTEQPISYEDVAPMPGYQEEEIRVENIPF